jgi:hypothetical protein
MKKIKCAEIFSSENISFINNIRYNIEIPRQKNANVKLNTELNLITISPNIF